MEISFWFKRWVGLGSEPLSAIKYGKPGFAIDELTSEWYKKKVFFAEGGSDGITRTLNPCSRVRLPGSPPFTTL